MIFAVIVFAVDLAVTIIVDVVGTYFILLPTSTERVIDNCWIITVDAAIAVVVNPVIGYFIGSPTD